MSKTATEQGEKGSPLNGVVPPKDRRFGQPNGNPRHNGSWHKTDTPRYKMETIMKMSDKELEEVRSDPERTTFERSFANVLYLCRTATDIDEATKAMAMLEKMTDSVYGKMPVVNITAEADKDTEAEANKFIRGFTLP